MNHANKKKLCIDSVSVFISHGFLGISFLHLPDILAGILAFDKINVFVYFYYAFINRLLLRNKFDMYFNIEHESIFTARKPYTLLSFSNANLLKSF